MKIIRDEDMSEYVRWISLEKSAVEGILPYGDRHGEKISYYFPNYIDMVFCIIFVL